VNNTETKKGTIIK